MILLSHPTANQNVRQAGLAFAEAGLLAEFWTAVDWRQNSLLDQLAGLAPGLQRAMRRRSFPPELQRFIRSAPYHELTRQVFSQLKVRGLTSSEDALFSIDAVYRDLDRRVARRLRELPQLRAVYAYDGGALASFRAAKERGLKCVYEHPIGYARYVRRLQEEEAERHPEWRETLPALRDSDRKLAEKDAELAAADVVVVANEFSRRSLELASHVTAPIHVVPYGAPPAIAAIQPNESGKLRAIYVGALTQAKGLSYLFDAVAGLEQHLDLTLIGQRTSAVIPTQSMLDRHRWIPSIPHDVLLAEIRNHDVLVLPSLHEGFGLVILEAMSQGVPVITTPNTAGPDVIQDEIDGFIVPIRSSDAIRERLERLIRDRGRLRSLKEAARSKAASLPWSLYRARIAGLAREVIAN